MSSTTSTPSTPDSGNRTGGRGRSGAVTAVRSVGIRCGTMIGYGDRGFTLVELLVAVVLLLALSALVMPSILGALDEQAYETAVEVASSQLLLARAHAQATGEPVEVVYEPETRSLVARVFSGEGLRAQGDGEAVLDPGDGSDDDQRAIPEPWANRPLPGAVKISRQAPSSDDGPVAMPPREIAPTEPSPILLVVYAPSGAALFGSPVWLADPNGRAGRLAVSPWTGLVRFERQDGASSPRDPEGARPEEARPEAARFERPATAGARTALPVGGGREP